MPSTNTWDAKVLQVIIRMSLKRYAMRDILPAVNKLRPGTNRNMIISKRYWLRQNGYLPPETKFNTDSSKSSRRSVSYEELEAYRIRQRKPSYHDGHFNVHPAHRVSLVQMEADGCRWPYGEPGKPGFHFCCFKQVKGLPYCEAHAKRAKDLPDSQNDV